VKSLREYANSGSLRREGKEVSRESTIKKKHSWHIQTKKRRLNMLSTFKGGMKLYAVGRKGERNNRNA